MREIDTETTGLDPLDGHRIVAIGAVELGNRSQAARRFTAICAGRHCRLASLPHMVSTISDSEEE